MFTLAIIGRPNVGKSTLFNRLAGKRLAIVDDTPGVTRDWREAKTEFFDQSIRVIDTAGLEERFDESIQGRMRQQTEAALDQADAILFMVDGRSGITPLDEHFAAWLRRHQKKPVILGVNKAENEKAVATAVGESYGLGFDQPVMLSAAHGHGLDDLYDALRPYFPEDDAQDDDGTIDSDEFISDADLDALEGQDDFELEVEEEDFSENPLKIAIVGRPNVGKSTLLNAIVENQRVMTGPEAGITRDAIAVDWAYEGKKFRLVDTAGMRKKAKVQNAIEKMSVEDSLRAIRLAQVVILVVDGRDIFEKQDAQIAEHVINEGRALIIAVNKWDEVKERTETLEEMRYRLDTTLAQLKDVPFITISALNGRRINKLLEGVLDSYTLWNKRIATAGLNRWLARMESQNPAPLVDGRQNRLKYITQIKTRPPTFALWVSRPEKLPGAYRRFITNGLRRDYDLPGVTIRLLVRKSKNPYAG